MITEALLWRDVMGIGRLQPSTVTLLAMASLGCNALSGVGDLEFDLAPAASTPCAEPVAGMIITTDTTLCAGTYAIDAAPGAAAIEVAAANVTVTCLGTILEGWGASMNPDEPSVGIQVGPHGGVTIEGCSARGYGYGLAALGATQITLRDVHLDDNFSDPEADWVGDVRRGGILLEGVVGGTVASSSFSNNWNGIELRNTREVQITDNLGSQCSNTGAILLNSHDNLVSGNDLSWAIRGDLVYPDTWYGVDTKDSAGIILEDRSANNQILDNDFTYGGNGVFVRDLYGLCPTDNLVAGNDASFSPHNGIECWCDHNTIEGNHIDGSNFGIWTGGGDYLVIRGNRVLNSRVDGISIQIGEDRHTLIEDNEVSNSARVGILLSGREYQEWHPLTHWADNVANSSHIVVQRNRLFSNVTADIFVTSTRLLVLAGNCSPNHDGYLFEQEAEVTKEMGNCGTATDHVAPTAQLGEPGPATLGEPLTLDASASTPSTGGDALSFTWLVQPAAVRFPGGVLPPYLLGGPGPATQTVTIDEPGLYDVDVVVDDGLLASLAQRQVAALPQGTRIGELAADWGFACPEDDCSCTFTDEDEGLDGSQVHWWTDAAFAFHGFAPVTKDLGLDASLATSLVLFLRARNVNEHWWQGDFPIVVLGSAGGTISYAPTVNLMPKDPSEWLYLSVPLAGGGGWTRTDEGGSLAAIDWVELHMDTYGEGFDVWIDALTIF